MKRLLGAIVTLLLLATSTFGLDDPPKPVSLFDGKTLEGWVAEHADGFGVHDSVLAVNGGAGWLRSAKSYKNFELDAEFRIVKAGTEGSLLFRTSLETAPTDPFGPVKGYQLQLMDGDGGFMLFGHGTNPPRFERKTDALKAAAKELGTWRKLKIKVVGAHLEARLDDVLITTSDAIEQNPGHLGLIGKTGQLEWRNMTILVHPD
ncbi:3-keto-disaccharide hydrolase [Paludisphaera borealis]|uniref:3-keto-alpha-glucoside-1,2-lyase/3-keto-2-hydroxy-glucal hydratase domain-containing protein n=1 Tax=Paludisphaera borealis TaxID=1387353 RepID=A0A1U7CLN6_9BACT|nr:DUF1080 domain-containing protein [Paludisphaera borealis]APW59818.1 putative beta-jelly-roll-type glycoside hydrolase of unknown function [Paludisphaera borealis]MDR3620892.1 DUF1080 domain-containing protein [Paludisphaera borealis]